MTTRSSDSLAPAINPALRYVLGGRRGRAGAMSRRQFRPAPIWARCTLRPFEGVPS